MIMGVDGVAGEIREAALEAPGANASMRSLRGSFVIAAGKVGAGRAGGVVWPVHASRLARAVTMALVTRQQIATS